MATVWPRLSARSRHPGPPAQGLQPDRRRGDGGPRVRRTTRKATDIAQRDSRQDYAAEIGVVRDVSDAIPLEGRVLDVGGHEGRLREFLNGQEYVSCDPFIDAFERRELQPRLLAAFKCFAGPCNFVACHAEHLPFKSASFDIVHMRS
jgi:hypothetical protein